MASLLLLATTAQAQSEGQAGNAAEQPSSTIPWIKIYNKGGIMVDYRIIDDCNGSMAVLWQVTNSGTSDAVVTIKAPTGILNQNSGTGSTDIGLQISAGKIESGSCLSDNSNAKLIWLFAKGSAYEPRETDIQVLTLSITK